MIKKNIIYKKTITYISKMFIVIEQCVEQYYPSVHDFIGSFTSIEEINIKWKNDNPWDTWFVYDTNNDSLVKTIESIRY